MAAGTLVLLGLLFLLSGCSTEREPPPAGRDSHPDRRARAALLSNRGSLFLQQGRPRRALEPLRRAAQLDPALGSAHYNLGLAHARLEQHTEAVSSFRHALELQGDSGVLHFALGTSLRARHRYLEAAVHLEQAIALEPGRADFHFRLGEVRRATSDFAGALKAFAGALLLDSTHVEALYLRSDLLAREHGVDEARAGFERLLDLQPAHVPARIGLARVLIKQGHPQQAAQGLEQAVALEPRNANAQYVLGQAYTKAGRPRQAAAARERFRRLSAAARHLNQGNIHIRRHEWDQAAAALQRAIAADTTFLEARMRLGIVHLRLGRPAAAIDVLQRASSLGRHALEARCLLGDAQLQADDVDAAERTFVAALALDTTSTCAAHGVARILLSRGDPTGAERVLRRLLVRAPDHRDVHYTLGLAYIRQRRYGEAAASFRQAAAIDSTHVQSRYALGTLLLQMGDLDRARSALEKVLSLQPDHAAARDKLAELERRP